MLEKPCFKSCHKILLKVQETSCSAKGFFSRIILYSDVVLKAIDVSQARYSPHLLLLRGSAHCQSYRATHVTKGRLDNRKSGAGKREKGHSFIQLWYIATVDQVTISPFDGPGFEYCSTLQAKEWKRTGRTIHDLRLSKQKITSQVLTIVLAEDRPIQILLHRTKSMVEDDLRAWWYIYSDFALQTSNHVLGQC